ncbi:MAG TPA: hypothetical protein VIR16_11365, partial [Candidatus Limnocylindrales bacterium]
MPLVKAGSAEFLLVGQHGTLVNKGTAIQTWLRPGSIYIRVPSTKVEAAFEFTQETKDGIPLRFKGIFVYRVTDPIVAARHFDFWDIGEGIGQVTALLTHVLLGELRDAVSHLTMPECIEGRKTTLTGVAAQALATAVAGGTSGDPWGIVIEAAQVAQVFIVDNGLRAQLEAETRNEIRLRADQSNIKTQQETQLTQMASQARVDEQQLAKEREDLRRAEELDQARVARDRRKAAEDLATAQQQMAIEQERFAAQMASDQAQLASERPVRLAKIEQEREALTQELVLRELATRVKALEVEREMLLARAQQELRRE